MIRYLSLVDVLTLHRRIIEQSGGGLGIRNLSRRGEKFFAPTILYIMQTIPP